MAFRWPPQVGVLAVQGDVEEHIGALERSGARARKVKLPGDLAGLDGLVLPGGESTAIGKLLRQYGLIDALREASRQGMAMFGTCAGMILLADRVHNPAPDQPTIGGMDIGVRRNAFGSQVESFETDLEFDRLSGPLVHAVFIRAPTIEEVGARVQVLARLPDNTPVAALQGRLLVTSFHPELTGDLRLHELFLELASATEGATYDRSPAMSAP